MAGIFSVYAACTQQRLMTNLTRTEPLRAWLTADPEAIHSEMRVVPGHRDGGITKVFLDGSPVKASIPTVLTLTAPRTLLDRSMRCFLDGLGMYLASVWTHDSAVNSSKTAALWTMNTYYSCGCWHLAFSSRLRATKLSASRGIARHSCCDMSPWKSMRRTTRSGQV